MPECPLRITDPQHDPECAGCSHRAYVIGGYFKSVPPSCSLRWDSWIVEGELYKIELAGPNSALRSRAWPAAERGIKD